jgi:SagB-type dehydrogenase family enzyme
MLGAPHSTLSAPVSDAGAALSLAFVSATVEGEGDGTTLVFGHGRLPLATAGPGTRAALSRLATGGAPEAGLIELVRTHGQGSELAVLFYYLRLFDLGGLLSRTLSESGSPLVSVVPLAANHRLAMPELDDDQPVLMSRFAYLRRLDGACVLESPATHARVRVHDARVMAMLHGLFERPLALASLDTLPELKTAPSFTAVSRASSKTLLQILLATGHLRRADDEREQQPPLATWSFQDLLFHARSRVGRHDGVNGKTYPFLGKFDPLPALRPPHPGPVIELPRPDLERIASEERGFTQVLEARCSIREQGLVPITLANLAEFLYRAARVRHFAPAAPPVHYEVTNRPSPGGGGCHELELYLAVDRCEGLEPGLYHYQPLAHQLTQLRGRTPELDVMLADTKVATGRTIVSQVLVCVAARFGRMGWPYEGIPYATTLKNTGALLQTMYLVATAMGLAPCAIGRGNSDLFAKLAGTDYYAETTVGEFMLGSREDPT